ncbi:MAG: hypothetical protein ACR2NM_00430 [Bythopirellula sp.]
MASFDFSYDATPALAKLAARKHIWRRAGFWLLLNVVVLLSCLLLLVSGDRSWYVFVLPTFAGVKLWAWFRSYLNAGASVEKVANHKVTVCVDENGLKMDFASVESNTGWNSSMRIQQFSELWLITFADTGSSTYIPTAAMSEEVQSFIIGKVVENGGVVS